MKTPKKKKIQKDHVVRFKPQDHEAALEEAHTLMLEVFDLHRRAEKLVILLTRTLNHMTDDATDLRRIRRKAAPSTLPRKPRTPTPTTAPTAAMPKKSELFQRAAQRLTRPDSEG